MQHISTILGKLTPEEATWVCATCGTVAPYQTRSTGRYVPSMCICQKAAKAEYEAQQRLQKHREYRAYTYDWFDDGFPVDREMISTLLGHTFENFEAYRQQPAWESTQLFAQALSGTFILHGTYGTGKTHLLAALCQYLNSQGVYCRFTTAPNLFAAIRWCIAHDTDYSPIIRRAISAPLLVIDDIDKARWSEFREEVYFDILDNRMTANRPIAISTNRLSDLKTFIGGACVSRLSIRQIEEEMIGLDYRREL